MTFKNCRRSQPLKDGECGGCGTFENVTDNSCPECDKGYVDPTPQDIADTNEYYENNIKPLAESIDEVPQPDPVQMWKKLRAPVDYSFKAELERLDAQDESVYKYGGDVTPPMAHVPELVEDNFSYCAVGTGLKLIDLYGDKETFMVPTEFNIASLNCTGRRIDMFAPELAKEQQDAINLAEDKPFDLPKDTGKAPTNPDLMGLNKWIGEEGGLKRGELNVISSHNPLKP